MSNIIDFSELLITKFCHDISGHISAIDNGVELLQGQPQPNDIREKAFALLAKSSTDLIARLKIFRFAYGIRMHEGEVDLSELSGLLLDFYRHSKIRIIWNIDPLNKHHILTNISAKLLINLVLIVASCLVYGGEITISMTPIQKALIIHGVGSMVKVDSDLELILVKHEMREIKLSNIQIHLVSKLASELGVLIEAEQQPSSIMYSIKFAT